uniref:Uncharacterized protein n=1 Tax=Romanomermis culicivorax TaxID=13658 RepID=A0A915IC97_ROMCU
MDVLAPITFFWRPTIGDSVSAPPRHSDNNGCQGGWRPSATGGGAGGIVGKIVDCCSLILPGGSLAFLSKETFCFRRSLAKNSSRPTPDYIFQLTPIHTSIAFVYDTGGNLALTPDA